MFYLSDISEERLNTCCGDLQTICKTVIQDYDFMVICGYRGEKEQNDAYNNGKSRVQFPHSKHNLQPSMAVDLAPYPIDWNDLKRFHELAGRILEVANLLEIPLIWGGHWRTFKDYPHFEIETE